MGKFIIKQENLIKGENSIPLFKEGNSKTPITSTKSCLVTIDFTSLIMMGYNGIKYDDVIRNQRSSSLEFIKRIDDNLWIHTTDLESVVEAGKEVKNPTDYKWAFNNYLKDFPFRSESDCEEGYIRMDCYRYREQVNYDQIYMDKDEFIHKIKENIEKICSLKEKKIMSTMSDDEIVEYSFRKIKDWSTINRLRLILNSTRYQQLYHYDIEASVGGCFSMEKSPDTNKKWRWLEVVSMMYTESLLVLCDRYSKICKDSARNNIYLLRSHIVNHGTWLTMDSGVMYSHRPAWSTINNYLVYIIHGLSDYINYEYNIQEVDFSHHTKPSNHYYDLIKDVENTISLVNKVTKIVSMDIINKELDYRIIYPDGKSNSYILDINIPGIKAKSINKSDIVPYEIKSYNDKDELSWMKEDPGYIISTHIDLRKNPLVVFNEDRKRFSIGRYELIIPKTRFREVFKMIKDLLNEKGSISLEDLDSYDIYIIKHCLIVFLADISRSRKASLSL